MNQKLKKIVIGSVCVFSICIWIYYGLQDSSNNNIKNHLKENDDSDLILKLLNKNTSINYDSLKSNNFISYYDSTNFTNILRNQKTHQIKIDEILSGNITEFFSVSYNKNTLINYKKYLKNNSIFNKWDSLNNSMIKSNDFNILEFTNYLNEVGFFKIEKNIYFYLKSSEPYNIESFLNTISESISNRYCNMIDSNFIFTLLLSEIYTQETNYYVNSGEYFIFSSDSINLKNIISENKLKNNAFSNFKNNQFNNYSLNYFFDSSTLTDSTHNIISYQLRAELNGVISNFKNYKLEKTKDTISLNIDSNIKNEQKLINEIIENTQKYKDTNNLVEITYYIKNGETFRDASVKLKEKMLIDGYDYNLFKKEHVYFIVDNGREKLNWNEAVNKYLDKKQPSSGDYFYFKSN